MIRPCKKEEFEKASEFAYKLALDLKKSGYPTYCDGIKTKEVFLNRLERGMERDNEEVLLFEVEDKLEGLIHYYWLKEDRYIQTSTFNIDQYTKQAISEFLTYIGKKFNGYDLYMGFPSDNITAVEELNRRGIECIEDDYNNTAFLENINDSSIEEDLIQISEDNYELFAELHCQIEGDMYWDSERIKKDLENWTILLKEKEGKALGAVYFPNEKESHYVIFGLDYVWQEFNPEVFSQLLKAALSVIKKKGGKYVTFFCDEESESTVLECGFTRIGRYLGYKIHFD